MSFLKVKDIVKETAVLLGLNSVLELPEYGGENEDGREFLSSLIHCVNSAVRELASEYIPLTKVEVVSGGTVPYTALSKSVFEVLSVKVNGVRRAFKVYPHEFTCPEGEATIKYSYLPAACTDLNGELEVGYRATERLVAYGAASDYCLMNGMLNEVDVFNFHYTSMIKNALTDNRAIVLPKRRWT